MIAFIDNHRAAYGVEPICRVLPIAPSTYHADTAKRADPTKLSARAQRDAALQTDIKRVWDTNFQVYGVRKVWRQLQREAIAAPRCQVARLMKHMGLAGAVRGRTLKTTHSDKSTPSPLDRVNRQFRAPAPNALWLADFTYVATWQGFVYVAFVIDAFARRIVGWRVSRSARADFVLDALEQALCDRRPVRQGGLVHHSDRGVQYLSIRYSERLREAGIEPSVGSVGDSYDNALAETINGLFKAEVIHRRGPWRSAETVELATLVWVDWFNNRRLLEPIGNIPPAEAEDPKTADSEPRPTAAESASSAAYLERVRALPELTELLKQNHIPLTADKIQIIADPPGKRLGRRRPPGVLGAIRNTLGGAQKRVILVSPYFVPGRRGSRLLINLLRRGVAVSILTNSLAATDVLAVHGGYARYRRRLLKAGVELHELKRGGQEGKSMFGSGGASLHTKAFVVDVAVMFVGSFNLDPRSANLNTEMGAVIEDLTLADQLREEHRRLTDPERSWLVKLESHRLTWRGHVEGHMRKLHNEPGTTLLRRFLARMFGWLPIEPQL